MWAPSDPGALIRGGRTLVGMAGVVRGFSPQPHVETQILARVLLEAVRGEGFGVSSWWFLGLAEDFSVCR